MWSSITKLVVIPCLSCAAGMGIAMQLLIMLAPPTLFLPMCGGNQFMSSWSSHGAMIVVMVGSALPVAWFQGRLKAFDYWFAVGGGVLAMLAQAAIVPMPSYYPFLLLAGLYMALAMLPAMAIGHALALVVCQSCLKRHEVVSCRDPKSAWMDDRTTASARRFPEAD